jgi:hypothetical protein
MTACKMLSDRAIKDTQNKYTIKIPTLSSQSNSISNTSIPKNQLNSNKKTSEKSKLKELDLSPK